MNESESNPEKVNLTYVSSWLCVELTLNSEDLLFCAAEICSLLLLVKILHGKEDIDSGQLFKFRVNDHDL